MVEEKSALKKGRAFKSLKDRTTATGSEFPASGNNRFLRVRVEVGNEVKVNMNIPLRLVRVFSKIAGQGLKFIPEDARRELEAKGIDLAGIDLEELVKQIEEGLTDGKIIDVDIDEPGEKVKVEIYVE